MTKSQKEFEVWVKDIFPLDASNIIKAVRQVLREERKRCARVADEYTLSSNAAIKIAERIRKL